MYVYDVITRFRDAISAAIEKGLSESLYRESLRRRRRHLRASSADELIQF